MRRPVGATVMLAIGAIATSWSCGGDGPVCGDGDVGGTEQCDDGNDDELDECRACVSFTPPRTIVKWAFNAEAVPGFTTDGCVDVNATQVRVELAGPMVASKEGPCSSRQVTFDGLPAGTYTAQVTPLDSAGASLVTAAATGTFATTAMSNTTEEHTVVVPPAAWARPMTGTYFFMLRWGGMPCTAAVATQTVTMRVLGVVSTRSTTSTPMYRLDGSQPVPCVMSVPGDTEHATLMRFGPAQVEVVGKDSGGAEMFRGTFDTFVGAGMSNPVLTLDVPSTIDAGVDAPPDATIGL